MSFGNAPHLEPGRFEKRPWFLHHSLTMREGASRVIGDANAFCFFTGSCFCFGHNVCGSACGGDSMGSGFGLLASGQANVQVVSSSDHVVFISNAEYSLDLFAAFDPVSFAIQFFRRTKLRHPPDLTRILFYRCFSISSFHILNRHY